MTPHISIIVPVYNVQPYLRQCMEGLIGQTLRDIEIICVDDGSTDGSSAILAEYAAKDGRIRVITQENAGLSAARNAGLDTAAAPLIMFCDSDDWYAPVMCEKMYAAMQNGADMAVCGVQETTQGGNLSRTSDYFSLPGSGEITPNDDLFLRTNVVAWNKIYRRGIIEGKQIRFPMGLHFEDEYLYAVYTAYIKTVVFVPNKLYSYRRREASIIGQARKNALNYAVQRVQIANRIWQYHEECQMVGRRLNYLISSWLRLCAESLSVARRASETQEIENLIVPFAKEHIIPHIAHIPRLHKERLELLLNHQWIGIRRRLGGMVRLKTRERLDPDSCTIFYRYRLFGIPCWKREKQYANRADKKKLLFCMHQINMGGTEKVLCSYIEKLLETEKYMCSVACPSSVIDPVFIRFFNEHGVSLHIIDKSVPPRKRSNFVARWIYKIRRVMASHAMLRNIKHLSSQYDVVIDFCTLGLAEFMRRISRPKIAFLHMSFNYCKRKGLGNLLSTYSKFVSVSQGIVHEFIEKYPSVQHKVTYIYNPLNVEQIQSLSEQSTLHVDSPYFVAVQRLNEVDKDVSTLIRGFALFKRKHPEYSLIVVGDGPQYEKFKRLAASEVGDESIIFTGQLDNPYPMIRSAQALILSSTLTVGEGLPTVLIEAQALGVAAVSSDVPSGPAEILMHGEAGYLFEAGNPESLAQVLEDIERHPEEREEKIRKATENLVRFSPSEAISRLEEIIQTADL